EVVVQTHGERVRIYVSRSARRSWKVVTLRRIVAIAFELPPWIRQEHTDAATIANSILCDGEVVAAGVAIKEGPLNEATELHHARKRRVRLVPPHVRRPHHGIGCSSSPEKVAQVGG